MTETTAAAGPQAAESPHLPRPASDGAALRAIEDATRHVRERALAILNNFASHDIPGRQAHIQDCVDEILAKVSGPAVAR